MNNVDTPTEAGDTSLAPLPCNDCKMLRKKCDRVLPHCSRCVKRRYPCVYRHLESQRPSSASARASAAPYTLPTTATLARQDKAGSGSPPIELSAATGIAIGVNTGESLEDRVSRIEGRIGAMEARFTSFLATQQLATTPQSTADTLFQQAFGLQLEDPDLQPTMGDWVVVYQYLRTCESSFFILSEAPFLQSFFSQPPALRLTFCAIAAHLQNPRLPDKVCFSYYARAQKAVSRVIEKPDLTTLHALLLMSSFASLNGQPLIGRPFFMRAVRMVLELQLNRDPDDLPECRHLSEEEREERRLIFWVMYSSLLVVKIAYSRPLSVEINPCVKPAKRSVPLNQNAVPDPRLSISPVCYMAALLDVIHSTVTHHAVIPSSTESILSCDVCLSLSTQLTHVRAQMPDSLILSSSNGTMDAFFATYPRRPRGNEAIQLTLYANSAKCLLHRTKLYLTGYLDLDSPQLVQNAANMSTLLTALHETLLAAREIARLTSRLYNISAIQTVRIQFWEQQDFACFTLFEAVLCLWYVTCRTKAFWFSPDPASPLHMGRDVRRVIRTECLDVLTTMRNLERTFSGVEEDVDERVAALRGPAPVRGELFNMVTPLVAGVVGMVQEMEEVERVEDPSSCLKVQGARLQGVGMGGFEDVVIGMKVISLDDDKQPVHLDFAGADQPWCFLGLLGVPGPGGMKWNAHYEPGWASFWEILSLLHNI
ncbi:hypothetical protein BC830DRAFT_1143607 [Chytriomyces sp. MP71]|nr:hypothetical protein BC830DRAFT_1143607 [Chytriomyces sp. MP71]